MLIETMYFPVKWRLEIQASQLVHLYFFLRSSKSVIVISIFEDTRILNFDFHAI